MNIPILECTRVDYGSIATFEFICPFCGDRHVHSAGPGDRVPHCPPSIRQTLPFDVYRLQVRA